MKKTLYLAALVYMPAFVLAEIPNAGSISREAETQLAPIQGQIATPTVHAPISASQDRTPIAVQQIILNGRTLLDESQFQPLLNQYIGKETTFGGLQILAQNIADVYHKAGYPLATALVPPQRIENGVITLEIVEGRTAGVELNNQSRVNNTVVQNHLNRGIKPNQALKQADSERALLLLKDLAGTEEVGYRLQPIEQGMAVAVDLGKAPLIDGFVQVDNHGSKSTGTVRTRAGVNFNSPFGHGERLSVQGMSSFKGVHFARLGADVPLGSDGLTASLGVAQTRYDLGGAFKDLDATGQSNTLDLALRYPIVRSNQNNVWLNLGAENRKLKDEVGATQTLTRKSLRSANVGINATLQDDSGYTQLGMNHTLGHLDIKSADALAIDRVSAKTDGNYYKGTAAVSRTQFITPKFSLTGSLNGQWANKNLDSAEQMSLGGSDSVAAYHSNNVSADSALVAQFEGRYAFSPAFALGAFYDVGRGKLRQKPFTDGENSAKLHGGGVGVYSQYKGLSLQGKVAWQGSKARFSQNKNPRVWVKAGYNF
ncbi:ShlB/FhaC/HecB family hemolysin secretion/activation protein [Alysiella filiformis]|uniref:Hemolysin activation/secretion protein n=1 Tax=Alysiella filiformis DSM 16848 TaxID=1120981 RepID=A0A286E395_9NEIS|nr:ShlB/FhaC/HecB family hemolysin secretion/activation protein [Alysiella filiformis]QMT31123.1 ShlB/FhaC/HecB family hemolysin secretion/activation protein [Alysiella filiformis]UBQ55885.1 ShlB/FhaC/HecB family hemolysin secretion/activation protein [Alysiella filiformis DSM 16848]SOD65361.1 Hemolysin activation/secretion protein [Alysiella filiformis DSM 16848]